VAISPCKASSSCAQQGHFGAFLGAAKDLPLGIFPVASSGPQTFNLTALIAAADGGVCRGALISLVFVPGAPPATP
jgi:hypothetical protein